MADLTNNGKTTCNSLFDKMLQHTLIQISPDEKGIETNKYHKSSYLYVLTTDSDFP